MAQGAYTAQRDLRSPDAGVELRWLRSGSEVGLRVGGEGGWGPQLEGPKGDLDLPPKVCYGTDDMCPRRCGKGLDQGDIWPKRGGLERRGGEEGWGGEVL